jgi:hypothetical protein
MALKIGTTTVQGLQAPNAYHRIEDIQIHSKARMTLTVRSYCDDAVAMPAFSDMLVPCDYDAAGQNPFKQGYAYLKTLPFFNGALDV